MSERLFVYGTLRRGQTNHDQLRSALFIGPASTASDCALYVDDYPYLNPHQPLGRVKGELFELSVEALRELDEFEEVPVLYRRARIHVDVADDTTIDAWTYVRSDTSGTVVPGGEILGVAHKSASDSAGTECGIHRSHVA